MTPDLGGPYTVVVRAYKESLVKNEKRSVWAVTLRNMDGHTHTIVSKTDALWKQYPFGAEVEFEFGKGKQSKLAVDNIRKEAEDAEEEEEET